MKSSPDETWSGTWVALVTPFSGGRVDEAAFAGLIHHCIAGGVSGIVPCGTTGEAVTLTAVEYRRVLEIAVSEARGKVPVLAGTGTNSTATTIDKTGVARQIGCDGALVVTPYYNKPTQAGLVAHYEAVASGVQGFPIVLYNVPGRTGVNMLPATVEKLASVPGVVAVKEACGSVPQVSELMRRAGDRIAVLSGDDVMSLPMYALGAHGVISVAANVVPDKTAALYTLFHQGRRAEAARVQAELEPLFTALFVESNPGPAKAALAMMGLIDNELRLPLVPVEQATADRMRAVLTELGVALATEARP
jgi:4-hydroxy-tetrahydrodipicolinate synthase